MYLEYERGTSLNPPAYSSRSATRVFSQEKLEANLTATYSHTGTSVLTTARYLQRPVSVRRGQHLHTVCGSRAAVSDSLSMCVA